MEYEITNNVR